MIKLVVRRIRFIHEYREFESMVESKWVSKRSVKCDSK